MKNFSDFGIKPTVPQFTGRKINILEVLNCEITVHSYNIVPSKYAGKGNCLYLQIEVNKEKRVIFIGSQSLIDLLEQVPKDGGFPFKTKIIKQDMRYQFS